MGAVMASYKARGIVSVGFGDLFLEDLRAWRENNLARAGMPASSRSGNVIPPNWRVK
jgi:hypothetical protein